MLSWIALVLGGDMFAGRRRLSQRYRFVSLAWLRKILFSLAIARVAEMAGLYRPPSRIARNATGAGFRRRINRAGKERAILGSRLRKALRARTLRERTALLLAAFSDLDAFVRRFLLPRALKRLTKLCAIVLFAPPPENIATLVAPCASFCADTS
ncbi:MAG: hypothetical protein KF779_14745 [Hyphomonadaceae bacterium]|nr:hypothetical protein [Hyphomonadaceae bacterium]